MQYNQVLKKSRLFGSLEKQIIFGQKFLMDLPSPLEQGTLCSYVVVLARLNGELQEKYSFGVVVGQLPVTAVIDFLAGKVETLLSLFDLKTKEYSFEVNPFIKTDELVQRILEEELGYHLVKEVNLLSLELE